MLDCIHFFTSTDSSHFRSKNQTTTKPQKEKNELVRHIPQVASSLFFKHNESLGPPYHILVDTNFINFSIQNKLDLMQGIQCHKNINKNSHDGLLIC